MKTRSKTAEEHVKKGLRPPPNPAKAKKLAKMRREALDDEDAEYREPRAEKARKAGARPGAAGRDGEERRLEVMRGLGFDVGVALKKRVGVRFVLKGEAWRSEVHWKELGDALSLPRGASAARSAAPAAPSRAGVQKRASDEEAPAAPSPKKAKVAPAKEAGGPKKASGPSGAPSAPQTRGRKPITKAKPKDFIVSDDDEPNNKTNYKDEGDSYEEEIEDDSESIEDEGSFIDDEDDHDERAGHPPRPPALSQTRSGAIRHKAPPSEGPHKVDPVVERRRKRMSEQLEEEKNQIIAQLLDLKAKPDEPKPLEKIRDPITLRRSLSGTVLTFPPDHFPSVLLQGPAPPLPSPQKCHLCSHQKKYLHLPSNHPVCSLKCYKLISELKC
eukprot:TRINITY_DN7002_c0_g1_i1.p1 TRINITY_DN7002_c0_g1~~TRINITY_DN7002_c0_g1_i1.p1  ORF type:complete len:386 (-),score=58.24 TRINITY_DN7002_c0_g1_i1:45-1202(-)